MTRRVDTVQLEHRLFYHDKISEAGKLIDERNGRAIALGFYTAAILLADANLTDGVLSVAMLEGLAYVDNPLAVADALARVGLFERENGKFRIHDFLEYNPSAKDIKAQQKADRVRKRRKRVADNGR